MLRSNRNSLRNVLHYWRDLEFFLPFDLDEVIERNENIIKITQTSPVYLPWVNPSMFNLDPERRYGYDLYFAPFNKSQIRERLCDILPTIDQEKFEDPRELTGLSCFARVILDEFGRLNLDDLSVSTLPWALGCLCKKEKLSLSNFDEFIESFIQSTRRIVGVFEFSNNEEVENNLDEVNEDTKNFNRESLNTNSISSLVNLIIQGSPIEFFPNKLIGILVPYPLRKRTSKNEDRTPPRTATNNYPDLSLTSSQSNKNTQSLQSDTKSSNIPSLLEQVRKKRKIDILNSFCLRDLERVYEWVSEKSPNLSLLESYTQDRSFDNKNRIDLLSDGARSVLKRYFSARSLCLGRWPSDSNKKSSLHQQLVTNRFFVDGTGIHSVNGPPGTGKTTLLRDIFSEIIVRRAINLSKLYSPKDAFQSQVKEVKISSSTFWIRPLIQSLTGFEIVVASNNNAAVENITKELPKYKAISHEYSEFRYLESIAKHYQRYTSSEKSNSKSVQGEIFKSRDIFDWWGLPSIALGNKRNRDAFRFGFLRPPYKESDNEKNTRTALNSLTLREWRNNAGSGGISFHNARHDFLKKLTIVESENNKLKFDRNCSFLNLDTPLNSYETQLEAPYQDPLLNHQRNELFLAALKLHESWLREVPRLESEIAAIDRLISSPQRLSSEDALTLWQIFFMIVPIVSTTLASVERMFAPLGAASLGNVIIDEAGQATPQSTIGILARAKKALIVGDQMQLKPIVQIPSAIEEKIALQMQIDSNTRNLVSPLISSAQSLADQQEALGTLLGNSYSPNQTWIGMPLLIHRRCAEPMFSLSNSIAYNNLMINAQNEELENSILGDSHWLVVKGEARLKQWVPEQGMAACKMIAKALATRSSSLPDLFVITPFKAIRTNFSSLLAASLKELGYDSYTRAYFKKRIGTIHTFQGREAECVILLLGCDQRTAAGADWAGSEANLLNVAITRAKKFLYVIGDDDIWHRRGYFSDLEKALPKKVFN